MVVLQVIRLQPNSDASSRGGGRFGVLQDCAFSSMEAGKKAGISE
jgi:hypothetical protein